jgi:putative ABC transport system permease protein
MLNELRYALRGLLRTPGFSVAAVLTLGLGIGVHTAIFSMVDSLLFRPLPYRSAEQLVHLHPITDPVSRSYGSGLDRDAVSTWASHTDLFEGIAVHRLSGRMVLEGTAGDTIYAAAIAPGFMRFLGEQPLLGREFVDADVETGQVILSHAFWTSLFAADREVLGKTVTLDGHAFVVVGVMPPQFFYPPMNPAHVWTPLSERNRSVSALARLRAGVSADDAQRRMDQLSAQLQQQLPRKDGWLVRVRTLAEAHMPRGMRLALWLLIGAVGLVVVVACANAATLFLGRNYDRMKEISVRAALGASRGRLIANSALEAMLVAGAAGVLALMLNAWLIDISRFVLPTEVASAGLNGRVIGFAVALALFAALLCGFGPAARASRPAFASIIGSSVCVGGHRRERRRAYWALVTIQLALTFVLLLGTALLAKSFMRLTAVDVGFSAANLAVLNVELHPGRYPTVDMRNQFYREAQRRVALIPGVAEVTAAGHVPPNTGLHSDMHGDVALERKIDVVRTPIAPNFFRTLKIPLLAGRSFDERDAANSPPVVIVNNEVARDLWPNETALGRRLHISGSRSALVVGVVGNVQGWGFRTGSDRYKAYLPFEQEPLPGPRVLVARTAGDPSEVVPELRRIANTLDPNAMIREAATVEGTYGRMLTVPRLSFQLMAAFSGGTLLLALVGIYGLVAASVAQRRQEIGIRMALGADASRVRRMVVREALGPALVGLSIGLLGGAGASMLLRGFLYGLSPHDPMTIVAVSVLLMGTVAFVAWLPARRATTLDPIATLRVD